MINVFLQGMLSNNASVFDEMDSFVTVGRSSELSTMQSDAVPLQLPAVVHPVQYSLPDAKLNSALLNGIS